MPFEIQTDEEEYRLAIPGGDVGPEVEYGCHATLDVEGVLHFTLIGLYSIDADTADVFAVRMDGPPDMVFTAPTVDTEFVDDEDEDEDAEEDDGEGVIEVPGEGEEEDEDIFIPASEDPE